VKRLQSDTEGVEYWQPRLHRGKLQLWYRNIGGEEEKFLWEIAASDFWRVLKDFIWSNIRAWVAIKLHPKWLVMR